MLARGLDGRWNIGVGVAPEPGRAQQNASAAPSQPSLEYQVKAAFLLNFTKFIEWAPSEAAPSDSPFAICVIGEDPFGLVIEQIIQGETVNGRKLAVQRITTEAPETATTPPVPARAWQLKNSATI